MMGLVELVVRLGTRIVRVEFIVCERLAAPMILGCDFCDRFVEAIYPRQKAIALDDGTTVPIVRRPLKRAPKMAPLPSSQRYGKADGRTSPKVRVALKIQLPPESQTWVSVTSERHGMMVLQPYDTLYETHGVLTTNGLVQVQPEMPFRILVANFTKVPKTLVKNQVVGTLLPHPTEVIPSKIHLHEIVGLVEEPFDRPNSTPLKGNDPDALGPGLAALHQAFSNTDPVGDQS